MTELPTEFATDTPPIPSESVVLRDSEEIERYFFDATGMKPGYVQLTQGPANLRLQSIELAGVTLIWCRAQTKARWHDEMTGDKLHVGFAIESNGSITSRGQVIGKDAAQIWMPGKEMDLIMGGPNLTLEIAVDNALVEALGWTVTGDPLQRVFHPHVDQLIRACGRATEAAHRSANDQANSFNSRIAELWRDQILDLLESVIDPWLSSSHADDAATAIAPTACYQLVRLGDAAMTQHDLTRPFFVDQLADALGVPRRSLFHAYRKVLGIGPRQYFELRRLHQLRHRLRTASHSDTTVTAIATDLGFSDLGRMAANYRQQFGENPSYTLKHVSES